jgi:hypothetical protein
MSERFKSVVEAHVVLRHNRRVLLLRRAGDVYASGQPCLPSGHLEEGESIPQAAAREAREEPAFGSTRQRCDTCSPSTSATAGRRRRAVDPASPLADTVE